MRFTVYEKLNADSRGLKAYENFSYAFNLTISYKKIPFLRDRIKP